MIIAIVQHAPPPADTPLLEKMLRDAHDYWFYLYQPQAGDVILDVGAGRGEDTYAFSRAVGLQGTVWALEPHPDTFAWLERLVREQRLMNVRCCRVACMDQTRDFQIETLPVWESNYVRDGASSATSHRVQGMRLDDFCHQQGITRIDFLKMNIEGAERWALRGAAETLQRAEAVCIAAHDFRAARGEGEQFRTLELVRKALQDAGFVVVTRDQDARYYVPYHVHGIRPPAASTARNRRITPCAGGAFPVLSN